MESVEGGSKMPCGLALAIYGVTFVGLCASTGGAALCGVVGLASSLYEVFAAC